MVGNTHTTNGEGSSKETAEATITRLQTPLNTVLPPIRMLLISTPSNANGARTDKNVVDFDPKQCQWNALRDVIYAKQNTSMSQLDICKALKVLYPDEMQFHNMSSMDIEKMAQWWSDPSYPYRHRPLFCGYESYENLGLRLKHALSQTKAAKPLAAAPVTPMRTASPRNKLADIPLLPRHPSRDSTFTMEATKTEKTETRRSHDREAAKQRTVSEARKVKSNDDFTDEITRQQSLTCSTTTKRFKITSDTKSTKPLLQNDRASTYCAEISSNPANNDGQPTHSHAEDNSTSDLGSLRYHSSVEGSSNASTLRSKAQFQEKPMRQSLMLAPSPQLMGFYSVKYPNLPAKSNPNTRLESRPNSSPAYWNYSTPPHSPSGSSSNSRPVKRQALEAKPTIICHRNGAGHEQLPSISSLFPSEHWKKRENLCLKTSIGGPYRTSEQDKNKIITTGYGANPLHSYGRQDLPVLLPPLELPTPSLPSLSPSSLITPTTSIAKPSTPTIPSPPSSTFLTRKRYSSGTPKYLPPHPTTSTLPPPSPELPSSTFSPSTCPWLAIRDVALARAKMRLSNAQIALLLRHRYGSAYPLLKHVTTQQVQELWEASRRCTEEVYTERDCGGVEWELWSEVRRGGLGGWRWEGVDAGRR